MFGQGLIFDVLREDIKDLSIVAIKEALQQRMRIKWDVPESANHEVETRRVEQGSGNEQDVGQNILTETPKLTLVYEP